jgi:Na+-translocating ferredoxin:NAD+ oxidoreductase subunit B
MVWKGVQVETEFNVIGVHPEQRALAEKFTSVFLFGPPMSAELLELICHLFTVEEACIAKLLPLYVPRSLDKIARRARKKPEDIRGPLESMSEKRVIFGGEKGYSLMPLLPGMFEYLLMNGKDSPWHRRYGQLINALYATGYTRQYSTTSAPVIRNIPVETVVESKSHLVDADLMSRMIDAHDVMGVLHVCQCRQSHVFSGDSCKRSHQDDGCLVFGTFAESIEERSNGRLVSREEMRKIVRERWDKNLVFMTANLVPSQANAICTCCDCCCHYLQAINRFEGMVSFTSPHFRASVDPNLCNDCGRCIRVCNTHAHTMENRKHSYDASKCIGCGLCIKACQKYAVTLKVNPDYQLPSRDWLRFTLRILPRSLVSSMRVALSRKTAGKE